MLHMDNVRHILPYDVHNIYYVHDNEQGAKMDNVYWMNKLLH